MSKFPMATRISRSLSITSPRLNLNTDSALLGSASSLNNLKFEKISKSAVFRIPALFRYSSCRFHW